MRIVQKESLESGMVIVRPLYDEDGRLLLASNHELTPPLINKIIDNDSISAVYIYDKYSSYEDLSQLVSEENRIGCVKALRNLNIDQVIFYSSKLVDDLLSHFESLAIDVNELRLHNSNLYEHSFNVAMLSAACGIARGYNDEKLCELTTAAMLHDIGKLSIPREILEKPGKLTDEEFAIIKEHPRRGYDMLRDAHNIASTVRNAIILHHENDDGTGYPFGKSKDEISDYAKIIHVADVYDALTQKRAYKEDYNPQDAVEYLMGQCDRMFNYETVLDFLKYLVVFPVGTNVKLSNGKTAHVIKNKNTALMRPTIITEDEEIIDLSENKDYLNVTILGHHTELSQRDEENTD